MQARASNTQDKLRDIFRNFLRINRQELNTKTSPDVWVARIMLALYYATVNGSPLLTNENYDKLINSLKKYGVNNSDDQEKYLQALDDIFLILRRGNLLNQTNVDWFFDLNVKTPANIGTLSKILHILTCYKLLTPDSIKEFSTISIEENATDFEKLKLIIVSILSLEREKPTNRIGKNDISYIKANYKKIPMDIVSHANSHIPRHLYTIEVFRDLVIIAEQNPEDSGQALRLMYEYINRVIARPYAHERQNQVNYQQSVHNDVVEKSVDDSAKKLKVSYPNALLEINFNTSLKALRQFADKLSQPGDSLVAKVAIKRLLDNRHDADFVREEMTNKQALILVWVAMHDKSKYHPGVTLDTAKENFVKSMADIERAYNRDENGLDQGGASRPTCTSGTFNKIIASLNTMHTDVQIIFNSLETASLRLHAIIKNEIKKYLSNFPDTKLDPYISSIPELKSNIERIFKEDTDNTSYHTILSSLCAITIESGIAPIATVETIPTAAPVPLPPPAAENNNVIGRIKRRWDAFKNLLNKEFPYLLNPFGHITYNNQTEPSTTIHPLPHTRTLHTSLSTKIKDTYLSFMGVTPIDLDTPSLTTFNPKSSLGIIDYLTLGIFKIPELLFLRYATGPTLAEVLLFGIPIGFSYGIKLAILPGFLLLSLPITALIHLASKIAVAMENRKIMEIPVIKNAESNSTVTIKNKFKENHFPIFSKVSSFVTPFKVLNSDRKINHTREVKFSANGTLDYVSVKFHANNKQDIRTAHAIARVNRKACHELQHAQMLNYRMAR